MLKKTIVIVGVISVLIIITYFLVFYICNRKNSLAEENIQKLIPLVEKYYSNNSNYPSDIEEVGLFNELEEKKLFFFFTLPKITYRNLSNGFQIFYHQSPLGPFYGYDSTTNDWYFEE